jgi:hypothetical protein
MVEPIALVSQAYEIHTKTSHKEEEEGTQSAIAREH